MILTIADFPKGQVVACKHAGNRARYDDGYTLGYVKSTGKYVTVALDEEGKNTVRFELSNSIESDYLFQKSNSMGEYVLFPSVEAYLDHKEKQEKLPKISSAVKPVVGESTLTADQVRRIYEIINE